MNAEIYFVRNADGSWRFDATGEQQSGNVVVDVSVSGEAGSVVMALNEMKERLCLEQNVKEGE